MLKPMTFLLLVTVPIVAAGCEDSTPENVTTENTTPEEPEPFKYKVSRLKEPITINSVWDKPQWRNVKPLEIKNYMGEEPEYQPVTQAKVLYDDENIYVIFRVEDQYVRAVAEEYHGPVWKDSCVEFFFTPGEDLSLGYLNLEVNCGGTALFHYQKAPGRDVKEIGLVDMEQIRIAHSLPRIVDPEITIPTTWTIEYRLPLAIIEKYCQVNRPGAGVIWRANFYKCAENNSHPHWLTWAFVDNPTPSFHKPEFFGTLEFAE